ncbi:hypothetical protein BC937DRAFT_91378 [Endogone sp. FLAS-F59071]|nr:hypothetical protein BC937DRAFT_91378 [Endogone sp. FLAS-F59071]|eukprot:RUS21818.1 hypothetical protein BC937DRAFT_91378 [Endogone sp. FLAS-F59071]
MYWLHGSLGVLFGQTIKAMGSAARVFEFIHLQPVIPTHGGIIPDSIEGNIEFRNVYFSYPTRPDHQVLSNFSLIIRKGTMVALCGPSGMVNMSIALQIVCLFVTGSGKSTVGSLIERFYEANKGGIYVDGLPIESLDPAWLRQQIGYINQEPTLFATTILENIRYGRPQATKEEVVAAARRANADAFIESFPDEYDTIVGERGVTLSGGQKQRIAIARAILKDPKSSIKKIYQEKVDLLILILDEATSALGMISYFILFEFSDICYRAHNANMRIYGHLMITTNIILDTQSEELVQEALDKLMEGRTVIVIAHRLSTIQAADTIIVMGRVAGNIIEQVVSGHLLLLSYILCPEGSHKELLSKRGLYFQLY